MRTNNFIGTFFAIILIQFFSVNANGQISFTAIDTKLQAKEGTNQLTCISDSMTVKFSLKKDLKVLPQNNFVFIDSQTIQIMIMKFEGYRPDTKGENLNNQKELLEAYSKYELDYFQNELSIEIINPNSQWVLTKYKGWLIWYFKVGEGQIQVDKKTEIHLFATTVIADNILVINAPILTDGDFSKAALIVNDLMEGLMITEP